jgi:hypothetical protein
VGQIASLIRRRGMRRKSALPKKSMSTLAARSPVLVEMLFRAFIPPLRLPLLGRLAPAGVCREIERQVKPGGPLSRLDALLYVCNRISSPLRRKPAIAQLRSCVHFPGSLLRWVYGPTEVSGASPSPSGMASPIASPDASQPDWARGPQRASQRRLRAFLFADIPTPLPIQNTFKEVVSMFPSYSLSASLALDACANTSALVRQRFSITSATVIALVLATPNPQPITGSALRPQHLAVNRPLSWGSA